MREGAVECRSHPNVGPETGCRLLDEVIHGSLVKRLDNIDNTLNRL